ncbi:type II toxin-antitoxin system RelE/ParE family toxin [Stieleria neptunia]|uniref:type II toxin-antitoxin system RelE/ParE family toxin n=1 Tax=Stieleria neptunia TaxID=2527979 RepID=UPI0018D21900|nr:type II toxin-antitoxin system RelE/ParE family toxin [Stieleria neptunia]
MKSSVSKSPWPRNGEACDSGQPLAQDDLRRQAEFIAKDSLVAALRLLDAAEVTYDFLAETPLAGSVCQFTSVQAIDLRIWRINGFPNQLILYRVSDSEILIVRVLHAARDLDVLLDDEK